MEQDNLDLSKLTNEQRLQIQAALESVPPSKKDRGVGEVISHEATRATSSNVFTDLSAESRVFENPDPAQTASKEAISRASVSPEKADPATEQQTLAELLNDGGKFDKMMRDVGAAEIQDLANRASEIQ